MAERPILFSAPMVNAILASRKTQTRRIVKRHPLVDTGFTDEFVLHAYNHVIDDCPYGKPGDRLWVREAWAQPTSLDPGPTFYRADYPACVPSHFQNVPPVDQVRWRPSIHMPRWASRITLRITDVRIQRLHAISAADAIAEGCKPVPLHSLDCDSISPVEEYRKLWERINGGGSWTANPWVWVVSFERLPPQHGGEP